MAKVVINDDVWDLIEELTPEELAELHSCIAAYRKDEEIPVVSRIANAAFKRIALDSKRKESLSEKRKQAANKRWNANVCNDMQSDANQCKPMQTDANVCKRMQEKFCITEEEKERSKEREEAIDINTHSINNTSSSVIKRSVFIPPTIEQIKAYAEEKGYSKFNPEQFWNFYESKNWMVGKNKMANWKSAVSGWALRDKQKLAESAKPTTDYKAQLSKLDYGALLRK